jgi:hypothetical protein
VTRPLTAEVRAAAEADVDGWRAEEAARKAALAAEAEEKAAVRAADVAAKKAKTASKHAALKARAAANKAKAGIAKQPRAAAAQKPAAVTTPKPAPAMPRAPRAAATTQPQPQPQRAPSLSHPLARGRFVGTQLRKQFKRGWFAGKVVSYNTCRRFYRVLYSDKDSEEMSAADIQKVLRDMRDEPRQQLQQATLALRACKPGGGGAPAAKKARV